MSGVCYQASACTEQCTKLMDTSQSERWQPPKKSASYYGAQH
jgi:hypothetical protein